ncbi:MAG TPA: gamma-glutamyltransferase [Acidimicrobiales bacterium]|nr:gamma-glutamyltransferase [Acidimicrobiales bacterium]
MASLAPFATRYAVNGMVCAVDHLAAEAGVSMLRAGGSAADAAVATSAVLAVTTQHMCGMGGDLQAVVCAPGRDPVALVGSGRAGSGADADALRAEGHRHMPVRGDIRTVTVPACVDGWVELHAAYGRLALSEVLEPARAYAADGFPASQTLAPSSALVARLPGAQDYPAHLAPGGIVRRPGVARTLAAIGSGGRRAFYEGEFGAGLVAMAGGYITPADLEVVQAVWSLPVTAEAWGLALWTTPPPTQGYLAPAAAWIASGLDLPSDSADPAWAHLLIEAARQAGADRVDVLHEAADGTALVDPARLGPRRTAVSPKRAAELPGGWGEGGTIGLCAVDSDRLGVAMLQSNATGWGAHLVEASTGIFLHNRGLGFSLQPGHPAEYGPGRRPPHTLSPLALTTADGGLRGVMASMGGDSQPLILLQLLARRQVCAEGPGDAVAAGRWSLAGLDPVPGAEGFSTWNQRGRVGVVLEGHCPPGWAEALAGLGHRVSTTAPFDHGFGHAHVIAVEDDHLAGASDPRPLAGAAAGY